MAAVKDSEKCPPAPTIRVNWEEEQSQGDVPSNLEVLATSSRQAGLHVHPGMSQATGTWDSQPHLSGEEKDPLEARQSVATSSVFCPFPN